MIDLIINGETVIVEAEPQQFSATYFAIASA